MAVRLAGQAIRSVALGVVVTAVAQSVVAGIGLAVAGVPFAPMLTALIFILCLIQLGPGLVMFPAVIWMYYSGDTLWATRVAGVHHRRQRRWTNSYDRSSSAGAPTCRCC